MHRFLTGLLLTYSLLLIQSGAWAQTGSRITEAVGNHPESSVWFSEPGELDKVLELLQGGHDGAAVDLARAFVGRMENLSGNEAALRLYHGYNALCSAQVSAGKINDAIDSCTRAVELAPGHWQALNNRASVYYASRRYDMAMLDYRQAYENKPDSEEITDLLRHNIDLTEARIRN